MSAEQFITVSEDDDGQRLDRWLKTHMPYVLAQKLIRKGAVRVNGKKVKPDSRIEKGQEVRIPAFEEATVSKEHDRYRMTAEDAAYIKSLIIYQDEFVIALNKPSGLAVQGGTGTARHIDGMVEALADRKGVKPRLVHRLDKDTSGVLLMARSAEMARKLGYMFKTHDIKKIYVALTAGVPEQSEGTIKAPLMKADGAQKERMVVDEVDGKHAETEFVMLEKAGKEAAHVAFWPRTGRTHQIRVHAADVLGCPILGDGKYGGIDARIEGLDLGRRRMHLHASRLVLKHPGKPGTLNLYAPLPQDLAESWKSLGFMTQIKDDPFAE
jgi:23S rRNA pseudouridine955/2504/2580 synthase